MHKLKYILYIFIKNNYKYKINKSLTIFKLTNNKGSRPSGAFGCSRIGSQPEDIG